MTPTLVLVGAGLAIYLLMSIAAYAAFATDKSAARRGDRRIPESTLLWLGFIGGWPGGLLAQRRLRHKTRKQPFRTRFAVVIVGNLVALVLIVVITTILGPDTVTGFVASR